MKKGLLVLQYWPGDQDKANRLARFITALEPRHRQDVDFLFLGRHDAKHDPHTVSAVSRKFDVWTYNTPTQAAGHPWAAWCMWHSVAEWVYHSLAAKKVPSYKFVFTFEADTVPIHKDWISHIVQEWEEAKAYVVGSETFHHEHHINGNLMYSTDSQFLSWLVREVGQGKCPTGAAWDLHFFPQFVQWGVRFSRRIWNCCGLPTMSRKMFEDTRRRGVSFVHGVKDDSLFNLAREAFGC